VIGADKDADPSVKTSKKIVFGKIVRVIELEPNNLTKIECRQAQKGAGDRLRHFRCVSAAKYFSFCSLSLSLSL
jgi:hypothetical protein